MQVASFGVAALTAGGGGPEWTLVALGEGWWPWVRGCVQAAGIVQRDGVHGQRCGRCGPLARDASCAKLTEV